MRIAGFTHNYTIDLELTGTQLRQVDNGGEEALLYVNLNELKAYNSVPNPEITIAFRLPKRDFVGHSAQLWPQDDGEDAGDYAKAALLFYPDGSISIGCTKFDPQTADKILAAIMRS